MQSMTPLATLYFKNIFIIICKNIKVSVINQQGRWFYGWGPHNLSSFMKGSDHYRKAETTTGVGSHQAGLFVQTSTTCYTCLARLPQKRAYILQQELLRCQLFYLLSLFMHFVFLHVFAYRSRVEVVCLFSLSILNWLHGCFRLLKLSHPPRSLMHLPFH